MTPSVSSCYPVVPSRLPPQPCNHWSVLRPYSFCLFQNIINGSRDWPFILFKLGYYLHGVKCMLFGREIHEFWPKTHGPVTTTTIKTQSYSLTPKTSPMLCFCGHFLSPCCPLCPPPSKHLFFVPIILSSPESHINRILMYLASECIFSH